MKEDNEYYSATKERLKETVQELRETVSGVYYVFLSLQMIISNEEKNLKWIKFRCVR